MDKQFNQLWYQLCQLAIVEPGSKNFLNLVAEANLLLDVKDAEITALLRRGEMMMSGHFERWKELAALCLQEQDPAKLTALANEMNLALTQNAPYLDPPRRAELNLKGLEK